MIKMKNFEHIFACGDIHGSYLPIENFYCQYNDQFNFSKETDCIILLGDTGLNFYMNHRDRSMKKHLEELPFTYFVIRGNHDRRITDVLEKSYEKWHIKDDFEGTTYIEEDYPSIHYAFDDANFYKFNQYNFISIPGAYSVDKFYRIQKHWTWFDNEQLTEEEMQDCTELLDNVNWKVDGVLSHTCPIIYEPTDLFLSVVDQTTVDKTMERYLGAVEYKLDYKLWLWGHYHAYRIYPEYEGKQCIMLGKGTEMIDILECFQTRNFITYKI